MEENTRAPRIEPGAQGQGLGSTARERGHGGDRRDRQRAHDLRDELSTRRAQIEPQGDREHRTGDDQRPHPARVLRQGEGAQQGPAEGHELQQRHSPRQANAFTGGRLGSTRPPQQEPQGRPRQEREQCRGTQEDPSQAWRQEHAQDRRLQRQSPAAVLDGERHRAEAGRVRARAHRGLPFRRSAPQPPWPVGHGLHRRRPGARPLRCRRACPRDRRPRPSCRCRPRPRRR